MPRFDYDNRIATYDAAAVVRERVFRDCGSLLTPERTVWTLDAAADLKRRFIDSPDESGDKFMDKLERQFDGASDASIQLMAEMLYVHLLTPDDIGQKKKLEILGRVLGWMTESPALPKNLEEGLSRGFAKAGMGFGVGRPNQIRYLIRFAMDWIRLPLDERVRFLGDPWTFKEFVYGVDETAGESQRNALLFMVHEDSFEDIVSQYMKRDIVKAFANRSGEETDVDRAIRSIRHSLEDEFGTVNFFDPEFRDVWQPEKQRVTEDLGSFDEESDPNLTAWLVRAGRSSDNRLPEWLAGGYCAIGGGVDFVKGGLSRQEITDQLRAAQPDLSDGRVRASLGNIDRFVNQMSVGDFVVTPRADDIYVGMIKSDAFRSDTGYPMRRDVAWVNIGEPISRKALSDSAYSKLRTLLTVSNVSDDATEFVTRAGLEAVGDGADTSIDSHVVSATTLPDISQEFAESVLLPEDWLSEVVGLLRTKRQVVFYGPPGTGKTFLARELADYLTGADGSAVVQFHPSYTYEDFFEGYRPQGSDSGTLSFELVPGPLRVFADLAREDRANPYILVIDEINRANLAKVFGELYFLLEYRDASITLQYGASNEFTLPKNLYVIGTMNTADKSIAFIDAAMRRRFFFVPFFPTQPPIDGLLSRWLGRNDLPEEPVELLRVLNERIGDDDFAVGPSYLMSTAVSDPAERHRIWKYAILPMLEEHFYGSGRDIEREFGLDSIQNAVSQISEPDSTDHADLDG